MAAREGRLRGHGRQGNDPPRGITSRAAVFEDVLAPHQRQSVPARSHFNQGGPVGFIRRSCCESQTFSGVLPVERLSSHRSLKSGSIKKVPGQPSGRTAGAGRANYVLFRICTLNRLLYANNRAEGFWACPRPSARCALFRERRSQLPRPRDPRLEAAAGPTKAPLRACRRP